MELKGIFFAAAANKISGIAVTAPPLSKSISMVKDEFKKLIFYQQSIKRVNM